MQLSQSGLGRQRPSPRKPFAGELTAVPGVLESGKVRSTDLQAVDQWSGNPHFHRAFCIAHAAAWTGFQSLEITNWSLCRGSSVRQTHSFRFRLHAGVNFQFPAVCCVGWECSSLRVLESGAMVLPAQKWTRSNGGQGKRRRVPVPFCQEETGWPERD